MSVTTKYNFVHAGPITLDIIDTLLANGFKAIFPVAETPPNNYVRPTNLESFSVTLEAQGAVDPLNAESIPVKQPWRINFTVYDNATMGIVVGSDQALPANGELPYTLRTGAGNTTFFASPVGVVGDKYTRATNVVNPPAAQFNTCLQWSGTENTMMIRRNQLSPDHPLYSSPATTAGNTEVAWDSSMESSTTYPTYCTIKAVSLVETDISNKAEVTPNYLYETQGFINRAHRVWQGVAVAKPADGSAGAISPRPAFPGAEKDLSATFPMSYRLVITNRGIFLAIWEGAVADASGKNFSWVLVQRPVDRDSGETIIDGKAPVFCVNSVGNVIRRFVVREADRANASASHVATEDSTDASAIINSKKQVGVSEDNTYVVNFPSRLNTPRYAYTYELDMIGYTSASVVSNDTEIPVKLYGEDDARTYFGMFANQLDNNGMRIVALQTGGGV